MSCAAIARPDCVWLPAYRPAEGDQQASPEREDDWDQIAEQVDAEGEEEEQEVQVVMHDDDEDEDEEDDEPAEMSRGLQGLKIAAGV